MAVLDLTGFEAVQPSNLNTGFYADIKCSKKSKKRIILIQTPKHIKAADIDGIQLDLKPSKKVSAVSAPFTLEEKTSGSGLRQCYQMKNDVKGEDSPAALIIPHADTIIIDNVFAEVWNMALVPEAPNHVTMTADLEDDLLGRNWRPVPQATNLRKPLSVFDISMQPQPIAKRSADEIVNERSIKEESPSKKAKKHKSSKA